MTITTESIQSWHLDVFGRETESLRVVNADNGRALGSVAHRRTPCYDGHMLHRWAAFGGGNHLGDFLTEDEAIRAVRDNFDRTAFGWHLALCDSGQRHSDVCPLRP